MIAHDFAPMRTFVVERQSLIARALHLILDTNPLIHVVGDSTTMNAADLQRTRPDLIMFGLDNAAHEIADAVTLARSVCPNVRICVLSSFPNPELMRRSMESGADGFILKDVSANELDVAFRIIANGSSYVDPRVAGNMLRRRESAGFCFDDLTDREGDILRLITQGLSNKEIGGKLDLAEKTIKNYSSRIFSKMNVVARTQAAVVAVKGGFV